MEPAEQSQATVKKTPANEENYKGKRSTSKAYILVLMLVAAGFSAGFFIGGYANSLQISEIYSELSTAQYQISQLQYQVAALQSIDFNSTVYLPGSLNSLYESVKDSIVTVQGLVPTTGMFGMVTYSEVLGSGFIVNLTGTPLIVTNFHVIDGMVNGSVTFTNGEAYTFTVVGEDKYSDLAIVQTPTAPDYLLKPLAVASSSTLDVGDAVVALGNPYGLQSTLTSGIVSQLNRAIQTETSGNYLISGVIQITAPINPGNSGGPLFDAEARVVGITVAIISDSQNVGFAIPSDSLIKEIHDLTTEGSYNHSYLGITGVAVDYLIANAVGLNMTYGVLVQTVPASSPANTAGIVGGSHAVIIAGQRIYAGGDIIIEADGQRIRSMEDLTSYIELDTVPGMTVNLTVVRGSSILTLPVSLGAYG